MAKINTIRRTQQDNRSHRAAAQNVRQQMAEFRVHLASPKFQGPCEDVINVRDVLARLDRMQRALDLGDDHILRRADAPAYEGRA